MVANMRSEWREEGLLNGWRTDDWLTVLIINNVNIHSYLNEDIIVAEQWKFNKLQINSKTIRAWTGFEPMDPALALQFSTN